MVPIMLPARYHQPNMLTVKAVIKKSVAEAVNEEAWAFKKVSILKQP